MISSLESIEDFLTCSICLNTINKTVTTSCGHRYCEKCIKEWVDRNSTCPCCKKVIKSVNLYSDHQYDSLIACVIKDRELKQKKYFEEVCMTSAKEACGQNPAQCTDTTSIEGVLRKHLQKSLIEHGEYFQALKNDFGMKKKGYEDNLKKYQEELSLPSVCESDIRLKISELEKNLGALQKEFDHCKLLVASEYDRYLTEHIPSLHILPVSVSVYIVDKDVRLPDVILKPDNSLKMIQDLLKTHLTARGEAINEWTNDPIYVFSPLVKRPGGSEDYTNILSQLKNGADVDGVYKSHWLDKPVLSCQMKPGSEIVLSNCVKFESDHPQCYFHKHAEGAGRTVDYYKCQDCGFNWICKSCKQFCHKEHNTSVHVLKHKPTWACCYCPKKKKCLLVPC